MAENRGYMQRYAMLFGTYMGGFWILKFILFPVGLSVPFLLFLFMGLTLCVPFMGYYYARMYRNQVCGGGISFLHAWIFTVFMYMFAALLAAVAHYIYFRFIDHGYVINTCETMVDTLAQSNMPGMDSYIATYQEALETTAQSYRHYATDDIVQCILGFDTGFPHRLVRDETQERRRSGRVTEQQKEMLFQL